MKAVSERLEKALAWVLVVLLTAMVLDVTWQVLSRFIWKNPSSFTEEIARFLLMWIGLLGAAYAVRTRSHLSLDLLAQYASEAHSLWLRRFAGLCILAFAASVMVYGGMSLVLLTLSLKQSSAALGLPIGLVYTCIPLSGLIICWFALELMVQPPMPDLGAQNNN